MCLCSKQFSLLSFYALPSGGKLKDAVVHFHEEHLISVNFIPDGGKDENKENEAQMTRPRRAVGREMEYRECSSFNRNLLVSR